MKIPVIAKDIYNFLSNVRSLSLNSKRCGNGMGCKEKFQRLPRTHFLLLNRLGNNDDNDR